MTDSAQQVRVVAEAIAADIERYGEGLVPELAVVCGWLADYYRVDNSAITAALASVAQPGVVNCAANPDHADIMETIAHADDAWEAKGYTSALAEVRDMANVGRALMEALPDGYTYNDCPSEIVADLTNERDEALAVSPAHPPAQPSAVEAIERRRRDEDSDDAKAFNRGLDAALIAIRALPSAEGAQTGQAAEGEA